MSQMRLAPEHGYSQAEQYFRDKDVKHILLVCGQSIKRQPVNAFFESLPEKCGIMVTRFSDFHPNPDYTNCQKGAELARNLDCDWIVACGGGSAMDTAKCIALWAHEGKPLPMMAIPTTAGSGSEATRFAVVYKDGVKLSVSDDAILPQVVILDPSLLETLPSYQRRATMMDALCHAIESFWSVGGTDLSRAYAMEAIHYIMLNIEGYLANDAKANAQMLECAYRAGKAINISRTTGAHAMAYKLTTKYQLAHGHAVGLCLEKLWIYMKDRVKKHPKECILSGGAEELMSRLAQLEEELKIADFSQILLRLGLHAPNVKVDDDLLKELSATVNVERLTNNPMKLDENELMKLYQEILS